MRKSNASILHELIGLSAKGQLRQKEYHDGATRIVFLILEALLLNQISLKEIFFDIIPNGCLALKSCLHDTTLPLEKTVG